MNTRFKICAIAFLLLSKNLHSDSLKNDAIETTLLNKSSSNASVAQAIDGAIKANNVGAVMAAAHSSNPDTRIFALKKLRNSDIYWKRQYLIETLTEDSHWQKIVFSKGEDLSVQDREAYEVAAMLQQVGITADKDKLYDKSYRETMELELRQKQAGTSPPK